MAPLERRAYREAFDMFRSLRDEYFSLRDALGFSRNENTGGGEELFRPIQSAIYIYLMLEEIELFFFYI